MLAAVKHSLGSVTRHGIGKVAMYHDCYPPEDRPDSGLDCTKEFSLFFLAYVKILPPGDHKYPQEVTSP